MTEDDRAHPGTEEEEPRRRRRGRWLTGFLVVALIVGGGFVAWRYDLAERWGLVDPAPDPRTDPAAVPAPPGVHLPDARTAAPVAQPLGGRTPVAQEVRRALGRLTDARRLGPRVAVVVADDRGRVVHAEGPGVVIPASIMKLLTALAALDAVGQEHQFTTEVVRQRAQLTLVGGGDPLLARRPDPDAYPRQADLTALGRDTARELRRSGTTAVRLAYDDSLFTGPETSPTWESDYLPDGVVSPITALWVDQGVDPRSGRRSADPAAAAARFFAAQLSRNGIDVRGAVQERTAQGGRRVAGVQSAPVVEIVQHVLETSDNEGAEVLARHVAIAEGRPASFAGASQATEVVLERLGVPLGGAVINDGSGLSRDDRLRPTTVIDVLGTGASADPPPLGGVVEGLPVAGFSGSLSYRFDVEADEALGWVRAKTGTLTGVHGLAGVVTGRDGTVMTFVAVADRVKVANTLFARARLDQITAALASCRCGR